MKNRWDSSLYFAKTNTFLTYIRFAVCVISHLFPYNPKGLMKKAYCTVTYKAGEEYLNKTKSIAKKVSLLVNIKVYII
ncbi:hypothetical protein SAMN05444483_104140 [Salegentibacter echinorum]|uniref:Uncharacterized protein n=1 Tax=Salegentibacter echinorum TaxID=1073325 RepID=A0A1M5GFN3_SALEC|nr:hypothetical protein SAMN05444483_104140 [Salegentibacter echinorum]